MIKSAFLGLSMLTTVSMIMAQNIYGDYPIEGVAFSDVTFSDEFWSPRILQNQETTIPIAIEQCYSTGRVANFQKAAALLQGDNIGYFGTDYPFDDTDIYKILEGMSYSYKMYPSQELLDSMNSLISIVAAAQEDDGYLFTARTAAEPGNMHSWVGEERWEYDPDLSHELYCSGHLFEAAVAHYQATGDTALLYVAEKNADLLVDQFLYGGLAYEPGHQIVEMGLVKMYRATGNEDYLLLAKYFLDIRGIGGPNSKQYEYNQTHKAPKEQTEAVGHAVRAVYMYSGMSDVAAIMDDDEYASAVGSIWENMSQKKYYITGGIGALHDGEAFGDDYELPNQTAYCETCAAIGNVYWNWRMFLMSGDSKYYDIIERTLYNGVLSGISLSGDTFFYPNPLESTGDDTRSEWFGCACCPSNLCRFMASVPGYVYAHKADSVYVNLFVEGTADVTTANGSLQISQTTRYPWDGNIQISIDEISSTASTTLLVRIPGWAKGEPVPGDLYSYVDETESEIGVELNGNDVEYELCDGYITLSRQWNEGDCLTIDFPMEVHRVVANENVEDDIDKVALERGPIVYCLEWPDNSCNIFSAIVEDDAEITVETDSTTFSSTNNIVDVLKIAGKSLAYDSNSEISTSSCTLTAIPYYAWANRGAGNMEVWIARTEDAATVSTDTIAATDTLTYEIGEVAGDEEDVYTHLPITVNRAYIADYFGVSFDETESLFDSEITYAAIEPSGSINTESTANDPGHWFGSDGNVVSWVEDPTTVTNTVDIPKVFSEFDASTYTFDIGQYPLMCSEGDQYSFRQALTYIPESGDEPKRVVLKFIVNITNEEATYHYALQLAQSYLADELYSNVTGEELTALEEAIALEPTNSSEYVSATETIYDAITNFVNAKGDYTSIAATDTLTYEIGEVAGDEEDVYTQLPITVNRAYIADYFGVSFDETESLFDSEITYAAIEPSERVNTESTANDPGHWFGSKGNVVSWVKDPTTVTDTTEIPRVFSEFDASTYTFNIGQYPLMCSEGEQYSFRQALTYTPVSGDESKRVVLKFIVNITNEEATYQYALQLAQNYIADELYSNITGEELTALEEAIALEPTYSSEYESATETIYDAITNFVNAKDDYEDLTSISPITADEIIQKGSGKVYNLKGQRVSGSSLTRGIYIIDGKKIIVK